MVTRPVQSDTCTRKREGSEPHVNLTSFAAMTDLDEAVMQACSLLNNAQCPFLLVICKGRLR